MTLSQEAVVKRIKDLVDIKMKHNSCEEIKEFSISDNGSQVLLYICIGLPNDKGFEFTRSKCTITIDKRGKATYPRKKKTANDIIFVPFKFTLSGLNEAFVTSLMIF